MSYAREQVELKIGQLAKRIVRGKRAKENFSVKFLRIHRFLSVIFVGGAGSPALIPAGAMTQGEQQVLVGVAFALALGLEVIKAFKVETIAVQALAAHEGFSKIEEELGNAIEHDDPMRSLTEIQGKAHTMALSFYMALPELNEAMETEAEQLKQKFIKDGQAGWNLPEDMTEDRGE